jgi:predicted MFS family arabinose efflux permease
MGKVIGHMDPRNFAVRTFGALALFMVFLIVTIMFPFHIQVGKFDLYYFLIIAMVFHGIFAATMSLLWYIGSAYFCKADEADIYQSIHLSLTGVRGLFAPIIGIFFYKIGGFAFTFALGAISLIAAIILQKWSVKKYKLKEE